MDVLHRLTAIKAHPKTATEFNDETIQSDTYVAMVKSACNAKNCFILSLNKCNAQTVRYKLL